MKVKILKAPANHWYSDMIGEEFSVIEKAEEFDIDGLFKVTYSWGDGWVYADDCEIIYEIWDSVSCDKGFIPPPTSDPKLVWWLNTSTPDYKWILVEKNMMKDYEAPIYTYPRTPEESFKADPHYNNDNGSLYLFAQHHNLNAWEFDIIKRVVRCRNKGRFEEDLEKTQRVIDLYLREYDEGME
jgi:hypothetical protein